MYKIHKTPIKMRPVFSDCASVTNPLKKQGNVMLQTFMQSFQKFFKDSFALKQILNNIVVPQQGRLLRTDDTLIYTNIDTDYVLLGILAFLWNTEINYKFTPFKPESLTEALELVMHNSLFCAGNLFVRMILGTAIGNSPALPYVLLLEGIHEVRKLATFCPFVPLYVQFIIYISEL